MVIFNYIWPHIDLGKSQVCAKTLFGDKMYDYKHGEIVEFVNELNLKGTGIHVDIVEKNGKKYKVMHKYKGTFRLVDKDFDKQWIRDNMKELKEEWTLMRN